VGLLRKRQSGERAGHAEPDPQIESSADSKPVNRESQSTNGAIGRTPLGDGQTAQDNLPSGNPDSDAPDDKRVERTSDDASTSASPELARMSWASDAPVVVGQPVSVFEPRAINETEHRTAPYRADTVLDGWSTKHFVIRGGAVRGYAHRYYGAPRQDDFAIYSKPEANRLIVAVADGVSAAKESHLGATTAVRYATQWLASVDERAEIDWQLLIESTAWQLIEQAAAILGLETADAARAERILATTLVCAVVDAQPDGVLHARVAAIGDSGAWVLNRAGYHRVEGGKSEIEGGLSSSAVSGLPRVPAAIDVAEVMVTPDSVLLLGTDGFGDPLGDGSGEVGNLFKATLLGRLPTITEFGHVLDFSRDQFDDDRALVAVWPQSYAAGDIK
jgi:serine/threonine protein phosphatase PrpC